MLGAIAGDVFGASYEFRSFKEENFDLFSLPRFFTDDTVLTIATAEVLMGDGDYAGGLSAVGSRVYPWCSYGGRFIDWLEDSSYRALQQLWQRLGHASEPGRMGLRYG